MARRRSVLVIDDDDDLIALETQMLEYAGYDVRSARDGREGLERVSEQMPHLILLDMRMPRMSGTEFAREFRRLHGHACPIIVVTAAENAYARAREVGAEGFFSKPFEMDELLKAAGRLVP
jgi:two-component system, chemotaxis family, chemotaxis protein CheY